MRAVIDTNVLVSALLDSSSPPALTLETVLKGKEWQMLLSPDLLAEYEEVLGRSKFSKMFDEKNVRLFLTAIALESVFLVPFSIVTDCEDADDNMLLVLAIDGLADCIVSGDNHLLKLHPFRSVPIISPADFLKIL